MFSAYGTGGLIRGFGLGLLVGQGFLGAKAGHSDQRFGCPVSFRPSRQASGGILFWLLEKQGKLRF